MCGIIGMVNYSRRNWQQSHDLLRALFLACEHRGRDATGFVAQVEPLDHPLTQKTVLAKEPVTSSQFVEHNLVFRRLRHQRCSAFLGHVRSATHGSPSDNANNHPHVADGLYLVHNGIVANYLELADRHALTLMSKCDSEMLLRMLEMEEQRAASLRMEVEPEVFGLVASRGRSTPRISLRILESIARTAAAGESSVIRAVDAHKTFALEVLDEMGLTKIDRDYLQILADANGPVRLNVLASRLNIKAQVCVMIEQFLVRSDLITKSEGGRMLTGKGLEHVRAMEG